MIGWLSPTSPPSPLPSLSSTATSGRFSHLLYLSRNLRSFLPFSYPSSHLTSSLFYQRIWGASFLFPIHPFLRFEEQVKKCQHKRNTRIRPTKIGGLVARLINLHLKLRDLLGVDVLSNSGVHHLLHLVLRRLRPAVLCTHLFRELETARAVSGLSLSSV